MPSNKGRALPRSCTKKRNTKPSTIDVPIERMKRARKKKKDGAPSARQKLLQTTQVVANRKRSQPLKIYLLATNVQKWLPER